jgi:hypothetical protein
MLDPSVFKEVEEDEKTYLFAGKIACFLVALCVGILVYFFF